MKALEKLISFLGRHFGPPWLFLLVAGWILALGVWGMVARNWLPMEHQHHWDIPLELRAPLYAKFDSGWYLSIIEWGYGPPPPPGQPSNHAFFPLYPMTAKVLHDTFAMDGFHAGLIVSYVCLFLAASLFWREAVSRLGELDARRSVVFLLLFPTAFYFAAVYAESMELLFALLAFRDARRGETLRAVLWGALLGLTRAFAITAGPALFLAALEAPGLAGTRRYLRAILLGAAPIAAVFLWIFGIGWVKHEPGLFFRSMAGWHRGSSTISGIGDFFRGFFADARLGSPKHLLDYVMVLAFAAIAIYQVVRRHWSDAAWTACAVGLPITTGLPGGIPRFFAVVYPATFALAEATRNAPRARAAVWTASGLLLLFCAARFVNWQWVA
ncbi:MAG TPA: mannosyltransferase family protein [Thermoanaerobaculia bacterium]|nr:mannosyltransferase family protein [Thermoanaerobaculia bacterium]